MADHRDLDDRHWSESTGAWYFVGSISDQWDHIRHDVEDDELADEVSGMFVLTRDGMTARPAPITREGWRFLAETTPGWGDEEVCCVGRVVDGMCVPIGGEDDDDGDDSDSDTCDFCGADRHDGCNCHENIMGFPEGCPSD